MINIDTDIQLGLTSTFTSIRPFIALYAPDSILEVGRIFAVNDGFDFQGDLEQSKVAFFNLMKPLADDMIARRLATGNEVLGLKSIAGTTRQEIDLGKDFEKGLYQFDELAGWVLNEKQPLGIGTVLPTGNGGLDNIEFYATLDDGQLFYLSAGYAVYQKGIYSFNQGQNTWDYQYNIQILSNFDDASTAQLMYLTDPCTVALASFSVGFEWFYMRGNPMPNMVELFSATWSVLFPYIDAKLSS